MDYECQNRADFSNIKTLKWVLRHNVEDLALQDPVGAGFKFSYEFLDL